MCVEDSRMLFATFYQISFHQSFVTRRSIPSDVGGFDLHHLFGSDRWRLRMETSLSSPMIDETGFSRIKSTYASNLMDRTNQKKTIFDRISSIIFCDTSHSRVISGHMDAARRTSSIIRAAFLMLFLAAHSSRSSLVMPLNFSFIDINLKSINSGYIN